MSEEKRLLATREYVDLMITISQRLQARSQVIKSTAKDELDDGAIVRAFELVADIVEHEAQSLADLSNVFYEAMLKEGDEITTS